MRRFGQLAKLGSHRRRRDFPDSGMQDSFAEDVDDLAAALVQGRLPPEAFPRSVSSDAGSAPVAAAQAVISLSVGSWSPFSILETFGWRQPGPSAGKLQPGHAGGFADGTQPCPQCAERLGAGWLSQRVLTSSRSGLTPLGKREVVADRDRLV